MFFYRSIGLLCGILVGVVLCVVFFRYANTDKKIKTNYDERQEGIRNKAYKYAFYTVLFYEALLLFLGVGDINLPIPSYALNFFGIILGCTVLGVYCVFKDVFWGMNNNKKRYFIVFTLCILLNLFPVIGSITSGMFMVDGIMSFAAVNFMVLFMFAILLIAMIIKAVRDKGEET